MNEGSGDAMGGNDSICGLGGNDLLVGGDGHDRIFGGNGDDTLLPGTGNDVAYGEAGTDTVSYSDLTSPSGTTTGVNYWTGPGGCAGGYISVCGAAGLDVLSGPAYPLPERFVGSPFDDQLHLDGPGTTVGSGAGGNDIISGASGDDLLIGGDGVDAIYAGAGNDTIDVRDGTGDTVNGDEGTDTVRADRLDTLNDCESVSLPPLVMPKSWVAKWSTKTGPTRTAKVGKTLAVTKPTFSAAGKAERLRVKYQWRVGGKAVRGATKTTFKVPAKAKRKTVSVTVTVSKAGYTSLSRTISYGKAR